MHYEKIELEEDEVIISIVRRHWFYVVKQCFFIAVLIFLPLLGLLGGSLVMPALVELLFTTLLPHFFFLYAFWLLILWMILASIWTNQYLDLWTITNKRIIKTDQVALFRRQIASFRLERLQDINVDINGIIATLLDYGTLRAKTASESEDDFKATYLPHPREVKASILKAADERMAKSTASLEV
jgi:hypothetical protein